MENRIRATMFSYDIPETAGYRTRNRKTGSVDFHALPNPSGVLRRLGERINLSVWILPDSSIPEAQRLAVWLQEHGANTKWCRFDETDPKAIRHLARSGAVEECERIRATIDITLASQRERLDTARRMGSEKDRAACLYAIDRCLSEAERAIDDAETAAALFDVGGDVADMTAALRTTIRAQERTAEALRTAEGIEPPRTRKANRIRSVDDLIAYHRAKEAEGKDSTDPAAAAQQTIAGCYMPAITPPAAAPPQPIQPPSTRPPVDVRSLPLLPEPEATRGQPIDGRPDDVDDPLAALAALDGAP